MALSTAQKTIAQCKARFRVVCAGRRFGKSHIAIRELAKFASRPDQLVWLVAPTYKQAKQIIWRKIKRRLTDLNWVAKSNETELTLELVNGSIIALKGADNYDSLRGVGLNFLVIDEAADIDPSAWYETLRPTLSDTAGSALFLGTPKGYNWFKELYDRAKTLSNWQTFQYTSIDGGRIPPEEIEAARQDLDERTFRQEYLASFEQYSGVIAYAFGEHNIHRLEPYRKQEPIIIGLDFNVTPFSAAVMRQTKMGLECFDEISITNSNTEEFIQEVKHRYPSSPITCYPDPAGVQRRTSASGQTDIKLLQNAGFRVLYRNQHPAVKDRINAANSVFKQREGTQRFLVDPQCRNVIKSLRNYSYKENTQVPDKDSGWDHMFDALTYAIEYIYPIRRDVTPQLPERFGHRLA